MDWAGEPDLWQARWLFQRGLGAIYLLAFAAVVHQYRPLLGEQGLTPVRSFVARVDARRAPSLLFWRHSDRFALAMGWTGVALSVSVLTGLSDGGPIWVSMATWTALWVLYLSIVNVGQVWYAFGWESLLCEAGFLAIWLGPAGVAPPLAILLLVRWLLFRVEFGAGLIKLRGDPCWRDLTCLQYHHETQPIPNRFSWWFHHLPRWAHRAEVGANHVTQLAVPFLLFAPQPVASVAAGVIIATQSWLVLSGNFAWLNALTLVLAVTALDGAFLDGVLPATPPTDLAPTPGWLAIAGLAVTAMVLVRSVPVVRNLLSPGQAMNRSFDPLRLVNTYGAFGSVTRVRHELVIEGTDDPEPGPSTDWRAYEFHGKPTDPSRRPRQIAPYHLRLDWLLWFAAMEPYPARHRWMLDLIEALLRGDDGIRRLLATDPFTDDPPAQVRVRRFRYRYTTREERRLTGAWWIRTFDGDYLPATASTLTTRDRW